VPVRRLTLLGFRSYAHLDLALDDGPHVVAGRNAAGKTNLLESIVVLSRGRSHRAGSDAELISWGQPFARLEADVTRADPGATARLEVVLPAPGQPVRKRVLVDGLPRRPGALSGVLRTVLFAPEDMLLVSGSPGLRRAVLDDLVAQRVPAAAASQRAYERALAQRNALLRRVRDGLATRDELAWWDEALCDEGSRILGWRHDVLDAISGPLARAHASIAPAEEPLTLAYRSNAAPQGDEDHAAALRRRLRETADKEVWNGVTLIGPHRDDLAFRLGERDIAGFASRGQQRTVILALKMAQLELLAALDGRPPLLLLDDVFSELDPQRRAHLVRTITTLPQAIVTTTSLDDLDRSLLGVASAWRVEGGRVHESGSVARSGAP
jgi:DNA replication and repair protein RecF